MKSLDEKGVVFLDGSNRPYCIAMWNGTPWLFYWHPDNHWVTLRPASQSEVLSVPHNLTANEQALYWKIHDEHNKSIAQPEEFLKGEYNESRTF